MAKLSNMVASATHSVCVYGPPKAGKTELVGKLAEHYNLIWFDAEKGWNTLLKLPKEWQERVRIIHVPDSKVYPIAAETWLKVIKGTKTEICEAHGKVSCALCKKDSKPFETVTLAETPANTVVVFDSLTQLSQSFIAHITKSQPDEYKLQHDDWGNLKVLVEKFLSQVQAAGYNIVCITHEEEVEMEDGKKKIVPVCGSSKSSRNTAKYFDHVVYCEVRNKKHVAGSSTAYGMNMITGSRTDVEMEKQAVPTLLDIFTSWKDGFSDGQKVISLAEHSKSTGGQDTGGSNTGIGGSSSAEVSANVTQAAKTPGQIALERMKSGALSK